MSGPGVVENLRAGLAYQLVLLASRIYPPLIGEMVASSTDAWMKHHKTTIADLVAIDSGPTLATHNGEPIHGTFFVRCCPVCQSIPTADEIRSGKSFDYCRNGHSSPSPAATRVMSD